MFELIKKAEQEHTIIEITVNNVGGPTLLTGYVLKVDESYLFLKIIYIMVSLQVMF